MLLFKTYMLEFEFDRHLEYMVSYQGIKMGFPWCVFVNSGVSGFLCKNDCLVKPDFSYFSSYKQKTDHIWTEYDHIILLTNHKSTLVFNKA